MNPVSGAILSVLMITGIMTFGKSYEKIGVSANIWYGLDVVLFVLLVAHEIRVYIKGKKPE